MNVQLEHLIVLQAQDLEIERLRKDAAAVPLRLQADRKALDDLQQQSAKAGSALAAEEKLRRSQESEIATRRDKVERLRRSLDSATSAAQVAAFEHEISFALQTIASLEEEAFASLERTELLEAEQQRLLSAVESKARALAEDTDRGKRTLRENTEALAGIETQRSSLRGEIEESWLSVYDRLRKAKGTAVSEALGNASAGKCSTCQMTVRTQRWQDLTGRDHDDQIFPCETCGRLLFWDPRRDTPRAWEIGDRLRRAAADPQAGSSK